MWESLQFSRCFDFFHLFDGLIQERGLFVVYDMLYSTHQLFPGLLLAETKCSQYIERNISSRSIVSRSQETCLLTKLSGSSIVGFFARCPLCLSLAEKNNNEAIYWSER